MEKMKLLRKRDFGTVLNDGLQFTFQNFGRYTKAFVYIVMPPITLMAAGVFFMYLSLSHHGYGTTRFASGLKTEMLFALLPLMLAAFVLIVIVSLVHTSLSYQYVLLYEAKDDPSQITIEELWAKIKTDLLTLFGAYMGLLGLMVLAIAITAGISYVLYGANHSGAISALFLFVVFFVWVYLIIALSNYFMIILRERVGVIEALRRCFILIKGNWWRTFGAFIVITILTWILHMLCLLPFTAINVISKLHSISTNGLQTVSATDGTLTAITQAVSIAVSFYFSVFMSFVFSINYYSLVENTDHTSLLEEIGQIGEKPDPEYKQEGSY